jgi:CRP/FNR family transcriptional regulator, anaerobic regulatory protein
MNAINEIKNAKNIPEMQGLPLEEELKTEMQSLCMVLTFDKDKTIVEEGSFMQVIPLLLNGSIRVFRRDCDMDREILLYYIEPGQTCMMSLVACFGDSISKVYAVTDKKSRLMMIPTVQVREWQKKYDSWNSFVINTFLNRYTELLNAFDELSFKNIDQRIQRYLENYSERHVTKSIKRTHMEIANELGTSRVVVSRILKNMENAGLVELRRGLVKLKK